MRKIVEQDIRDAELVVEVSRMSEKEDICEIEGVDSITGKSFKTNYIDLRLGKDSIHEAVERSNK